MVRDMDNRPFWSLLKDEGEPVVARLVNREWVAVLGKDGLVQTKDIVKVGPFLPPPEFIKERL
jgi:hypothetical protein